MLFLGLDLSTQSHSAIVITEKLVVVKEYSINFDRDLPHYKTQGGAIRHEDGMTVTAPVLMWVESLDLILSKFKEEGFNFADVTAIAFSGQQHGSVYWKKGARNHVDSFQPKDTLFSQLKDSFSVLESPIWMDSSTSTICREIESLMGGQQKVAEMTGSRCFERFTINQIAKIAKENHQAFSDTERISLVSSFLPSLFLNGSYASIDAGDGSGMNAMNIKDKKWIPEILKYASPNDDLSSKLGQIVESHQSVGRVSAYFQQRYGFSKECLVIAGSGDNPCTLAGLKLREGDLAVSLGTSDTIFGPLRNAFPSANEGNVMCNPVISDGFMGMICRKNGSLTREEVRNQYANSSWEIYSKELGTTPPGNDGFIGLYYSETEIAPALKGFFYTNIHDPTKTWQPANHVRGVVESQFLQMYIFSKSLGFKIDQSILATGGGSQNEDILQVLSDVFGVPVGVASSSKSASLGAAYRAYHGWKNTKEPTPFESLVGTPSFIKQVQPNLEAHNVYLGMVEPFKAFLKRVESEIVSA